MLNTRKKTGQSLSNEVFINKYLKYAIMLEIKKIEINLTRYNRTFFK